MAAAAEVARFAAWLARGGLESDADRPIADARFLEAVEIWHALDAMKVFRTAVVWEYLAAAAGKLGLLCLLEEILLLPRIDVIAYHPTCARLLYRAAVSHGHVDILLFLLKHTEYYSRIGARPEMRKFIISEALASRQDKILRACTEAQYVLVEHVFEACRLNHPSAIELFIGHHHPQHENNRFLWEQILRGCATGGHWHLFRFYWYKFAARVHDWTAFGIELLQLPALATLAPKNAVPWLTLCRCVRPMGTDLSKTTGFESLLTACIREGNRALLKHLVLLEKVPFRLQHLLEDALRYARMDWCEAMYREWGLLNQKEEEEVPPIEWERLFLAACEPGNVAHFVAMEQWIADVTYRVFGNLIYLECCRVAGSKGAERLLKHCLQRVSDTMDSKCYLLPSLLERGSFACVKALALAPGIAQINVSADVSLEIGKSADAELLLWLLASEKYIAVDWSAVGLGAAAAGRYDLFAFYERSFPALCVVIQQGCLEHLVQWSQRSIWTTLTCDNVPFLAALAHHEDQRGIAYWLLDSVSDSAWTSNAWYRLLVSPVIDIRDFLFAVEYGNMGPEPAATLLATMEAFGQDCFPSETVRPRLQALMETRPDFHDTLVLVANRLRHPVAFLRLLLEARVLADATTLWPAMARAFPQDEMAGVFVAILAHSESREQFIVWYLKMIATVPTDEVNRHLTHTWLVQVREKAQAMAVSGETMALIEDVWSHVLKMHPDWEAGMTMLPLWPTGSDLPVLSLSSSSFVENAATISPNTSASWDYMEEDMMYVY